VEVPVQRADEVIRDAGSDAKNLHEIAVITLVDQPKAAKRGRPAKEKKEAIKRQRITKIKKLSTEGLAGEALKTVASSGDHDEIIQDKSGRDAESSKKSETTNQINLEQATRDMKVTAPASKRLARKKQTAQTEQATTSPKDQQDNQEESVAIEERDRNIEKHTVRGRRREGQAPRYAESDGEEDSRPMKMKGTIKQAEAMNSTSSQSTNRKDEEARVNQDSVTRHKSSNNEMEESSNEVPKRRGRPPKKAVDSAAGTGPPSRAKKAAAPCKVQPESELESNFGHHVSQPVTSAAEPYGDNKSTTESARETLTDEVQHGPDVTVKRTDSQPRRRGRPPKVKIQATTNIEIRPASVKEPVTTKATPDLKVLSTKPRRGRPAEAAAKPLSASVEAAIGSTESTIHHTSRAGEMSSEIAQEVTAPKRRGRPPKTRDTHEVIVKATKSAKKKTAKSSCDDERPDVPITQPPADQQVFDTVEPKSTILVKQKKRKVEAKFAEQEEEQEEEIVVEKKPATDVTDERTCRTEYTKPAKKRTLDHAPEVENDVQKQETVRPPVLTARSTNLLVSPRRTRTTKPKALPMFEMTSKRKAQGEWQKEDWFEPSVPTTLLR